MNKKYIGSSLVGVGVFSSVLGSVAHAAPLTDEEWAKFEENARRTVNYPEKSFSYVLRMLISYINPFDWWRYFKVDCNFKRCTEDNAHIIRSIISTFKDTFDAKVEDALEYSRSSKTFNIKNDYDQNFSLSKELALLGALENFFKDFKTMNFYMLSKRIPLNGSNEGSIFKDFRQLINNALDVHYERNKVIDPNEAKGVDSDVLKRWRNLEKQNYMLELTKENIEICREILDILKNYFNLGKGAKHYLSGCQFDTLENVEQVLMFEAHGLLYSFCNSNDGCLSQQALVGGKDGFEEIVNILKGLAKHAAYNKELRNKLLKKGDWFKVGRLFRCYNFFEIEDDHDFHGMSVGFVEKFAEKYKPILEAALFQHNNYKKNVK